MSHRSVSLEPAGILALKDNSAAVDVRRLWRFELLGFMSGRVLRSGRPATRQPQTDVRLLLLGFSGNITIPIWTHILYILCPADSLSET